MRQASLRLLLGAALLLVAWLPAAHADTSDNAKIARLLSKSGYTYEKKNDSVWTVAYHGKSMTDFKVIIATDKGLAVVFVIVAHKEQMNMDQDLAMTMLQLNHSLDRVKVGIDDDGDAFVRADENVRVLDEEEFKDLIEQVAASADETYAGMQPYLKAEQN